MRRHIIAVLATASLVLGGLGALPAHASTATTGSVTIKVVLEGGSPLAGANVSLEGIDLAPDDEGSPQYGYASGETGADGTYTTDELVPGTYELTTYLRGTGSAGAQTSTITVRAGVDSSETVTFAGFQRITGKVTINGKPLARGTVGIEGGTEFVVPAQVVDGSYSVYLKSGRTYLLQVEGDRSEARTYLATYAGSTVRTDDARRVSVTSGANVTVDIAVYAKVGSVTGIVRDQRGRPVPRAYVTALATNRAGAGSVTSDSKGRYTIHGLPQGKYTLSAHKDFWRVDLFPQSRTYTVAAGRTTTTSATLVDKALDKGAISLKIKASASVWKRSQPVCAYASTRKAISAGAACASKASKKLTITGLAAGTYTVQLGGTNQSFKVVVKKNRTTTRTVARATGTAISGVVRSPSGKTLAKAYVSVWDANGHMLGSATTSSKGRYTVPGATSGKYTLSVRPADPASGVFAGRALTVRKGHKVTANVRLVKGATVKGTVKNSAGKGIAGLNVYANGTAGFGNAVTDAAGRYTISGLGAGKVSVTAYDPYAGGYYNTRTVTVTVKAGRTKVATTLVARSD